ncbi:uncharacterized protein FTJAE_1996 [Fusarium tjaetaba]|uniref:BZIP domain-containing protein n=1 Tax=Fusarium tjaetaba TaxID=1567544 RepID=A0A8H5S544_9HYPO|nr:uncharacterized protein FTJAE_1996 [Fusarium tjaetaba]KAF5646706.1 hypothetical protein FTJAE_1996 [Fusarium tjaetaba]
MNTLEQTEIDNLMELSEWLPTDDSKATDATDRTERRRLQNRQAQRNHRKKHKAYVSSLEQQLIENMLRGKQETYMPTPTPTPTSPLFMPLEISPEPSSLSSPLSLPADISMVPTPEDQQSDILSTPLSFSPDVAPYSHGLWQDETQHSSMPFAPFPGKLSPHGTSGMGCGCVTSSMPFHHSSTCGTSWQDMLICDNERASGSNRSHSCSLYLDRSGHTVPGTHATLIVTNRFIRTLLDVLVTIELRLAHVQVQLTLEKFPQIFLSLCQLMRSQFLIFNQAYAVHQRFYSRTMKYIINLLSFQCQNYEGIQIET